MYSLSRSLILTIFVVLFCSPLQAQRTFGVEWDIPDDQAAATQQLQQFRDMGISFIEISEEPSPAIWNEIDESGLNVYGTLGIRFPVAETFANADSALLNRIQTKASTYLSQRSVTAIGLFEHGAVGDSTFRNATRPFIDELKNTGNADIYFTGNRTPSTDSFFVDFLVLETQGPINSYTLPDQAGIGAFKYSPPGYLFEYLKPFKQFLDITSDTPEKPIFIKSNWLFSLTEKYPQFTTTLASLSTESEAIFPLPHETLPDQKASSFPIILLLIVWGTVALHYNSNPLYRKSLFRYFVGHKFFIEDIFQRHIRSANTAFIIIFQNIIIVAASVFATFSAVWSPLGMDAFFYYFPSLGIFGNSPISLLVWTCLGILVFSFVCILWLFLFHKRINSITQITTIYAWPLQTNFIVGTICLTLFASASSKILIIVFCLLTILVTLLSFVFTSVDATKYLTKKKQLYLFGTSGIYLILLAVLLGWAVTNQYLRNIINLTLSL